MIKKVVIKEQVRVEEVVIKKKDVNVDGFIDVDDFEEQDLAPIETVQPKINESVLKMRT